MRFPSFKTPLPSGAVFILIAMNASYSMSIRDLLAIADSTSPVLASARADVAVARAEFTSNRGWPNPVLFGEQETLSGTEDVVETSYGVQQNLGFLWTQNARASSAKFAYEAAVAEYEELQRTWVVETTELLLEFDAMQKQRTILDSVIVVAERLGNTMTARRAEGDVSAYEEQRVLIELIELQSRRQKLESEYQNTLRELVQQTGSQTEQVESVSVGELPSARFTTVEDAKQYAFEHRALLKQSEFAENSATRAKTAAKMNQLPDLNFGIGRKEVDNGSDGLILQAELEIPLFNQRRSQRNIATAQLHRAQVQTQSNQRLVEMEVEQAFAMRERIKKITATGNTNWEENATQNLERGIQLFLEGEEGSVQLIDALRTAIDTQESALILRNAVILAEFELRRVTGYNFWD